MLQAAREPFWLQPGNTMKTAYSLRKPRDVQLRICCNSITPSMTEILLKIVYCLEAPFLFSIALQHAFHRGTHVYTERKLCQMQSHAQKVCITKPLGLQNCVNHNKQQAISPPSPKLKFFICASSASPEGLNNDQWQGGPVHQVPSPSIH